jgi:hypothetical protein
MRVILFLLVGLFGAIISSTINDDIVDGIMDATGLTHDELKTYSAFLRNARHSYNRKVISASCDEGAACVKKAHQNLHWLIFNSSVLPNAERQWKFGSFERQTINMWLTDIAAPAIPSGSKCLEFAPVRYLKRMFRDRCDEKDLFEYSLRQKPSHAWEGPGGKARGTVYYGDIHKVDPKNIPDNTFDAIISTQVHEHLNNPFTATAEMYRILKPGGIFVFSAPHVSPFHLVPHDYYRYTHTGALHVVESAGFKVDILQKLGNTAIAAAFVQGFVVEGTTIDEHFGTPADDWYHTVVILAHK